MRPEDSQLILPLGICRCIEAYKLKRRKHVIARCYWISVLVGTILFGLFAIERSMHRPDIFPFGISLLIFPVMGAIDFSLFGYLLGLILAGFSWRKEVTLADILDLQPGKKLDLTVYSPKPGQTWE